MNEEDVKRESARRTRRAFLVGGASAAAAAAGAYAVSRRVPLGRRTLEFNREVARAVFQERGLAPEYARERAVPLRLNGVVGLEKKLELASWRLQMAGMAGAESSPHYVRDVTAWEYRYGGDVPDSPQAEDVKSAPGNGTRTKTGGDAKKDEPEPQKTPKASDLNPGGAVDSAAAEKVTEQFAKLAAANGGHKRREGDAEAGPSYSSLEVGTPGLLLSMDELAKQLPRVELVTEFKCVEGWSSVTAWGGFRLRDLLELYPPARDAQGREPRFVYMETPDGDYYGGYDLDAARHPQSLLVTHMHGAPLTQEHGAPLRLHMPIKYGYKQLKRIGLIAYTDAKPDDYWTKLGYDWYAGL